MSLQDTLSVVDRFQQRHRPLAFVVGILKKFSDDQAGSLAALISYYGFVSLFPLLLVFVTVLGFVVHNDPARQKEILDGTLGQIPIIKDQIMLHAISGSALALVVGILGSLWAGMGITATTQNAFNQVWGVPMARRPNFIKSRLRSLRLLGALGGLAIVSSLVAGYVAASNHGALTVVGGVVVALLANIALFTAAFMLLTAPEVRRRDLIPGILLASVLWQVLEHLGGLFAARAAHDSALYAPFAIVLGLLAWLYLGGQMLMIAAELNVVHARRYWPRSLFSPPLTDADRRALTAGAEVMQRSDDQEVRVRWRRKGKHEDDASGDGSATPEAASDAAVK